MSRGKHFKTKPKKNRTIHLLQLIFLTMIILSSVYIYQWLNDSAKNRQIKKDLTDFVTISSNDNNKQETYNIDFKSLKEKNNDTVGWLKVRNTNIDYPVVKSKDNDYYLKHSFDKSWNDAGWVFVDYRDKLDGKDKNIVVYGHNRKDGAMFGTATKFLSEEWYRDEKNRKILFATEKENAIYEVFSIYEIENEDYYIQTNFKNDSSFKEFISTIKSRSIKDFDINVTEQDSLLTLSTCGSSSKYRIVLHAKKIN